MFGSSASAGSWRGDVIVAGEGLAGWCGSWANGDEEMNKLDEIY